MFLFFLMMCKKNGEKKKETSVCWGLFAKSSVLIRSELGFYFCFFWVELRIGSQYSGWGKKRICLVNRTEWFKNWQFYFNSYLLFYNRGYDQYSALKCWRFDILPFRYDKVWVKWADQDIKYKVNILSRDSIFHAFPNMQTFSVI